MARQHLHCRRCRKSFADALIWPALMAGFPFLDETRGYRYREAQYPGLDFTRAWVRASESAGLKERDSDAIRAPT